MTYILDLQAGYQLRGEMNSGSLVVIDMILTVTTIYQKLTVVTQRRE